MKAAFGPKLSYVAHIHNSQARAPYVDTHSSPQVFVSNPACDPDCSKRSQESEHLFETFVSRRVPHAAIQSGIATRQNWFSCQQVNDTATNRNSAPSIRRLDQVCAGLAVPLGNMQQHNGIQALSHLDNLSLHIPRKVNSGSRKWLWLPPKQCRTLQVSVDRLVLRL